MRRKFLSVVLCVCMMLTMVPFAFAEENPSSSSSGSASGASSEGITTEAALKTAIANAATAENKTVTLGGDITLTSQLTINNSITLNGNGYTIKANKDTTWSTENSTKHLVSIEGTSNVTFENIILDCNKKAYNVQAYKSSNVTFKDVTIKNSTAAALAVNASSVSVSNDLTMIGNKYNSVNVCWGNSITGTDGTCSFDASNGNATLTGVRSVYADSGDVRNAPSKESSFTITLPNGWVDNPTTDNPIQYVQEIAKINTTTYASLAEAIAAAGNNDTVTLLKDTSSSDKIILNKEGYNITLDLGGNTYTKIGTPSGAIVLYAATLTIKNGTIKTVGSPYTGAAAVSVEADTSATHTDTTKKIATVIVNKDATIESADYAGVGVFGAIAQADIYGTVKGTYYGIAGNGVANATMNNGGYVINVYDGADITHTDPSDGVAIFMPHVGTMTIEGGNIHGLVGVQICSGTATINGGTITATGNTLTNHTYTSDGNILDGAALSIVNRSGYVGNVNVTVNGGYFTSQNGNAVLEYTSNQACDNIKSLNIKDGYFSGNTSAGGAICVDLKDGSNTAVPSITGGYFTTDPSDYCDEGLTGIPSTEPGYAFTVGKASTEVKPATAAPAVDDTKISKEDKATAKEVSESVTDPNNVLSAAANIAATEISKAQIKSAKSQLTAELKLTNSPEIYTYAQAYLKVTPTAVEKDKTSNTITSITMDIQPMYRVVASTKKNANEIVIEPTSGESKNAVVLNGSDTKLANIQTMEISLELPSTFTVNTNNQVYVQHKGHEYIATVTTGENNKKIATFTNPDGFSEFTISSTSTAVAKVGDNSYTTLQVAIDAVQNNETITLLKDTNENVTVSKAIKFTLAGKDHLKGSIAAGSRYSMTTSETSGNTEYTFTYVGGGSSSSISTPTTYAVNVNAATNGAVAADKKTASKGTTVTVTASPSKGYVVDAVKVVDKDGKDVAVTEKDGKYVFTMPASAVTVTGSFKAETPAPVALPFTDVKSGNWFYDAVKYAYEQGLMTGTSATTFAPNGTMNRAMIVTVLYRLEKSPAVTGASKFTDVPAGQWYSDAVAWAAANKIVNGYDETAFGPMNAVTREQMAAILFRYEQVKGLENVTLEENLNRFPDQNKISAYAIPALQWAVGQKIINGNADGTLDPTGTATRAQVAQIFTNLLNQ